MAEVPARQWQYRQHQLRHLCLGLPLSERSARQSKPTSTDPDVVTSLRAALKTEDFWPLQHALSDTRELSPAVRVETLLTAIARRRKASRWVDFWRALAELERDVLARKPIAQKRAAAVLAALDRHFKDWQLAALGPEVLRIAVHAPASLDERLAFFERYDLTSREFLELRLAAAERRREPTTAWKTRLALMPNLAPLAVTLIAKNASKATYTKANALRGDERVVLDELLCAGATTELGKVLLDAFKRLLTSDWEPHPTVLANAAGCLRFITTAEARVRQHLSDARAMRRLLTMLEHGGQHAIEFGLNVLHDHAGTDAVFALIQRAFEEPDLLAGKLCAEWFRGEGKVWAQLSHPQQALVVEGMLAADDAGIVEAHHALFYISAEGAEPVVTRELARVWKKPASKVTDRRFWSLIFALGRIGTETALSTVRHYAFAAVDDGIWECLDVLGSHLTRARLAAHLDAARAHRQPAQCHALLTAMVNSFGDEAASVAPDACHLEIAASAVAYPTSPYARFSILCGLAAALRTDDAAVARTLTAALGNSPGALPTVASRFHELRNEPLITPFQGDGSKALHQKWKALAEEHRH